MKKRPLVTTIVLVVSIAILTGAWLASTPLQVASYDWLLHDGPEAVRPWAVTKLETLGAPGCGVLVDALPQEYAAHNALLRLYPMSIPALASGLADPDPAIREAALDVVGDILNNQPYPDQAQVADDEFYLEDQGVPSLSEEQSAAFRPLFPALVRGLDNPNPLLRSAFLEALARLPKLAASVIPQLVQALSDPRDDVRSSAQTVLLNVLEDAIPALKTRLTELLEDLARHPLGAPIKRDPLLINREAGLEARTSAVRWIVRRFQSRPAAEALPILNRGIDAAVKRLRVIFYEVLSDRGEDGIRSLMQRLKGPLSKEVESYLDGVVSSWESPYQSLFEELSSSPEPRVRIFALEQLSEEPEHKERSQEKILAAFEDPVEEVRIAAILREFDSEVFWAALLKKADEASGAEQLAAFRALRDLVETPSTDHFSILRRAWFEGEPAFKKALIQEFWPFAYHVRFWSPVAALTGQPEPVELKLQIRDFSLKVIPDLRDPKPQERALAAEVLGQIGCLGLEALPALLRCCRDENPAVRREALRAIGLVDSDDRSLIDSHSVRVLEALRAGLKDPDASVRAMAKKVLEDL